MDKSQELRTNLVLQAHDALTAVKELSDGLDKIARLNFDNVKQGFSTLTKAFEAAQKMSTKVARVQTEDEKNFQNLLQKRAKIIKEMLDGYSKDRGFAKTEKWDGLRSQFESANIEIANFMKLSGRASEAVKYLQQALIAVANTPLYDPLKNQLAKLKVDLKNIKNDVNDRVSELDGTKQGKVDKVVSKELAKQDKEKAKEHAAEQKKTADDVRAAVNASKQAREAAKKTRQERAKAREEEAKAKAEQQKKDNEALQKYLGQKEKSYAKELAAEAKMARTRKENEEKRIEATKKRQEFNAKEWDSVQKALGDMERDPHRNDLYKTTGSYYPEMNRRERLSSAPSEKEEMDKMRAQDINSKRLAREAAERKRQIQAEEKAEFDKMKAREINDKRLARERQEREQQLANARLNNEKQIQAEREQNENRIKRNRADAQSGFTKYFNLQDKLGSFTRNVDFLKGKDVSETKMHRLEEQLEKIRRKALGIGATDIASKLTKDMLSGLRVVTDEQKKATAATKKRRQEIVKLHNDYRKLLADIEKHRGWDGQSYSKKAYDNTLGRINNLHNRAENLGQNGLAQLVSPSLLNGVNTKLGQFNARLSEAKDKTQQLYMQFRATNSATDKLSFLKAVNELKQLEHISEDFNRQINKAARSALTLNNIAKRAREHFNWTAGAYVENAVLSFPSNLVESISKYELAMAGIAQVIPKAEEGQRELNDLFNGFSDIAAKYGQSVSDAMESAKSIGRMYGQGDGDSELGATNTKLLTAQAAKMATVDNFDMLDATKGLESALAQFNLQTEDTNLLMARSNKILDVWTKLAHTSGASAQDLTQGVNQAGSSAREAGISFEFLNALIATGVRSTAKSGNEIGTTLKSMFASIQSDKAIKAMEKFGIQVYRMGANGRELRPMKDIILDISKALENTPKDTKEVNDFLLAVSGGKFQVSKIAAILGNYKELVRTSKLAHDSSGFTDKQLDLQMNTVSRKFATLKANIDKLFVASGSDGLANDLKWLLDVANRLATALQSSETHFYKWAKYGTAVFIAWKALPSLFNAIAAAAGRASVAFNMKNMASVASTLGSAWSTKFEASKDNQLRKMQGLAYDADSAAIDKNSAALTGNTNQQRANNLMKRAGIEALYQHNKVVTLAALNTNLFGTSLLGATTKLKMLPLVARAGSVAITGLSVAWRAMGAAVTALGGPLGAIMTLITVGGAAWAYLAEKEQEEAEAIEKKNEAIRDNIQLAQDSIENANENVKYAELLANKYNNLVDEQKKLEQQTGQNAEADEKYRKNAEELKNMQEQLKDTFHTSSIEFNQDGKINKTTIDNLSKAHKEAMRQKLEADKAVILSNKEKAENAIKNNSQEIESLKNLTGVMGIYAQAISFVHSLLKAHKKSNADHYTRSVQILDKEIEKAQERGDDDAVKGLQERRDRMESKRQETQEDYDDFKEMTPGDWWFDGKIAELEGKNKELELEVQKATASVKVIDVMLLSNMTKTGLSDDVDPTDKDVNAGKTHPESDAEKKEREKAEKKAQREANKAAREQAKLERQKETVNFRDSEVMDYVHTVAEELGSTSMGTLLSFAAALNGHNNPWQVQSDYYADKNIFKVPDWMTDKYSQGRTDEESRFWAFASWMKENQKTDSQAALENYYKIVHPQATNEEVKQKASEWNNEGLYFDDKHNYGKDKSKMTHHSAYDIGALSGDVITGSQYDEFINQMAAAYGVDKVLAHQIAEQESTHGKASSNVFQVSDSTGRAMGFSDMSNPLQSIEAGLKYFAKMLNESNGNVEQALKRYNGGGDPNYVANVLKHQYSPVNGSGNSSVWEEAEKHLGDKRIDYGAGDLAKECAAFVSTVLKDAGIEGLNSINVDRLRDQAVARGLYHTAGSGYQPKKGDVVIWGNHTGVVDGQGHYIARNSSGMRKGDMSEAASYGFGALQGYISTGAVAGRHPVYEWKNSANGGKPSLYNMEFSKQNTMEQWLKNREEMFKLQEQEIKELEEQGHVADTLAKSSEVARERSNAKAIYLTAVRENVLKSYKEFIQKMTSDSDVNAVLKRNNMTISEVNPSDMDELINRMKNAGKATQEIERLWKVVKEFNFDSKGESIKLKQTEAEAWREKLNAAKADGYLNPVEEEDYALRALDLRYQQQTAGKLFQDPRDEEDYHEARAEVYQHRLDRLQIEAQKADEDTPAEIERLKQKLLEAKEVRDNKKAALDNAKTPEETAKLTKELEDAQRYLDLQSETWRNVEQHGTQAQRKVAEETVKTKNELVKEQQAANHVTVELTKRLGNGVKSMFSDVLMEGKSFSESWKSLWTDIGKFALDRLLEIQLSRWGFDGIFGHAKGGKVDKKANGGVIPKFATGGYTNGLIRGAGTGTSDSILTYLAHRGQFIQTSNGEYIIKKSSVDKLGVGFLDTLNDNPDAIGAMTGLKRYATGGNLGESYSPSMSLKGVEAYRTFNRANMEKQQHFSTRKMEGLLQGLREDVQEGNKGDGAVTQPIILNTQADSASVMKAIAKNPRALQAILGNNQRRGFR